MAEPSRVEGSGGGRGGKPHETKGLGGVCLEDADATGLREAKVVPPRLCMDCASYISFRKPRHVDVS